MVKHGASEILGAARTIGTNLWSSPVGVAWSAVVKPTHRPGSLEEFIRLMPEGVGVVPVYLNFQRGTEDEFRAALNAVHEKVAELAKEGVDLIHPEGAPPFMVARIRRRRKDHQEWEAEFKIPIVTAAQTQVEALRALGIKKFVGVTYFVGSINDMFTQILPGSRLRCLGDGRDESRLRRRRPAGIDGNLRAHAQSVSEKSRRRRHLHARHRLALSRYHPSARRRFAGAGGSRRSGPRVVGAETSPCTPSSKGIRQAAGRDAVSALARDLPFIHSEAEA